MPLAILNQWNLNGERWQTGGRSGAGILVRYSKGTGGTCRAISDKRDADASNNYQLSKSALVLINAPQSRPERRVCSAAFGSKKQSRKHLVGRQCCRLSFQTHSTSIHLLKLLARRYGWKKTYAVTYICPKLKSRYKRVETGLMSA